MPERAVAGHRECLHTPVGVSADGRGEQRHTRRRTEVVPRTPAAVWRGLPDVFEMADGADGEHFLAAVGVGDQPQKVATDASAEIVPGAPAVAWRRLPDVPQRAGAHQTNPRE